MVIKRICVFCGSHEGKNPVYAALARKLGKELARQKIGLVFGAGSVGLMGVVSDAVLEAGGEAHGIIPEHLIRNEVPRNDLTELHITKSMHDRKALMEELSDAYITLPGGFGTFEEMFETITWNQLGIHSKPIILLNVDGYYDQLIEFVDKAVQQGFISDGSKHILQPVTTIAEAIRRLGVLPGD